MSELEKLSELIRGLEIPPNAINGVSPSGFYAIGASIAAQARQAVETIPKYALVELAEKWRENVGDDQLIWKDEFACGDLYGKSYCADELLSLIDKHVKEV